MLKFYAYPTNSNNRLVELFIAFSGDGTSSQVSIDLTKAPVGFVFDGGNTPSGVFINSSTVPSGTTVSATISGTLLTVLFSHPLPITPFTTASIDVLFVFNGVA